MGREKLMKRAERTRTEELEKNKEKAYGKR
jgi:hypothetical protein